MCAQLNKNEQKSKKIKRFVPVTIPRYLPGSVSLEKSKIDLLFYNRLRYNIFTAKTLTDTKPPIMNPYLYIKPDRLRDDAMRLHEIEMQNKKLVGRINIINRTRGVVDCWNPNAYGFGKSKWKKHENEQLEIDRDNRKLHKKIIKAKSTYSNKVLNISWQYNLAKIQSFAKYPLVIYERKPYDTVVHNDPSISGGLEQLSVRPKVFMDLEVKNGVFLGRLIMELYADYAPVTVQNFLSLCKGDNGLSYKNCPIHRIIKDDYFESGDITKGNGKGGISIYGTTFAEEKTNLKHTKTGVLSMVRVGDKENNSQFIITFRKLEKFDGKRVVFGHVIKGNKNLEKINDLGRKIGAPCVSIIILNCGELK